LLLGAGLLLKSFVRLRGVDPGFRPDRILTFTIDLGRSKYPDAASRSAFFEQIIERVRALPGVEAVGADGMLPFSGTMMSSSLEVEGRPVAEDQWSFVQVAIVNSEYFKTLGIPLLRGRGLLDSDREGAPVVAVVNEQFVREHLRGEDPLGKRLMTYGDDWRTIVGVVGNVRTGGLDSQPAPVAYISYLEAGCGGMSLAVWTADNPQRLAAAVRARVRSVDPDLPVYSMLTMEQRLSGSLGRRRLNMLLLASFSGLALALAAVEIYGVVAYLVTERTHEIGIRLVLGASPQSVLLMILRRGLLWVGLGMLVGFLGSIGLRRVIASELYGITPSDPATFVLVALVLTGVAMMACWFPARRATTVDPAVALRHE
jgi:putative ABC transport system permease protein